MTYEDAVKEYKSIISNPENYSRATVASARYHHMVYMGELPDGKWFTIEDKDI